MRLLLDTHTFLWFIQGNRNLSHTSRSLIEDVSNQKLVSVASLWEIAIKVSIGKLAIEMSITELVQKQVFGNAFEILTIKPTHLDKVAELPFHHKDPFDRLIVAQGLTENVPILSKDKAFEDYSVQLIW